MQRGKIGKGHALKIVWRRGLTSTSHEIGGRLRDGAIWQSCLHRTTQLYNRREDRVTLDEVVTINIRG
jgi:hypothetical protein